MQQIKDIPEFVNREKEIKQLRAVLSGRPNLVYFVYGPINSGKTALLLKVLDKLPENYVVFYINFRWKDVRSIEDLIRVMFKIKRGKFSEETADFIKELLKGGAQVLKKLKSIPIPENIFDLLFRKVDKVEDVFSFLEEYFETIKGANLTPVLVLDEMQTIKDIVNAAEVPVLSGLFNFLIGMTKEKHLCHSLCSTSDCLFIDLVYSSARLEGRAEYLLVDDLPEKEALKVYEEFGFEEKELIWDYIGGKLGDMVRLFEKKKQGYSEKEAVQRMLEDEKRRIKWLLRLAKEGNKPAPALKEIKEFLTIFKEFYEIKDEDLNGKVLRFLIEENILFYNPVKGTIRPQSQLIYRAIKELA